MFSVRKQIQGLTHASQGLYHCNKSTGEDQKFLFISNFHHDFEEDAWKEVFLCVYYMQIYIKPEII